MCPGRWSVSSTPRIPPSPGLTPLPILFFFLLLRADSTIGPEGVCSLLSFLRCHVLAMWVQAHQSMPDRSSRAALPSSPRQTGPAPDPPAPLQPAARLRTSVLVSKGGSFLLFDDPPAPAANPRDSISSTGTGPFFLDLHAPYSGTIAPGTTTTTTTTTPTPAADQRNERQQPWPPPRKESLSDNNPTPWVSGTQNQGRDKAAGGRARLTAGVLVRSVQDRHGPYQCRHYRR